MNKEPRTLDSLFDSLESLIRDSQICEAGFDNRYEVEESLKTLDEIRINLIEATVVKYISV